MTKYLIYVDTMGDPTVIEADRISVSGDYIELFRQGALVAAFNKTHVTHLTTL